MNFLRICFVFVVLFGAQALHAQSADERFDVFVSAQKNYPNMTIADALQFALPVLWKRVVPDADLKKTWRLKGRSSLVLQYKKVKRGVALVFNPVQVKSYLRGVGIGMIPVRPHWNLKIAVQGFSAENGRIASDLLSYSYEVSKGLGFKLSPRGKTLGLTFTPLRDVYGELYAHVEVQGAFSSDVLQETERPLQGYLSYQLQTWVDDIVKQVRDAYALGSLVFQERDSAYLLTISAEHTLATQVMLEQMLRKDPRVKALIPELLQKARRQYRVVLQEADDAWIVPWFATYGLTATAYLENGINHWLVE